MPKESLANKMVADNKVGAQTKQPSHLSDSSIQDDLTLLSPVSNTPSKQAIANNISPTNSASPASSPSKGTPTKSSKNKRKNEAKRRSANLKRQQQQQTQATNSSSMPLGNNDMAQNSKLKNEPEEGDDKSKQSSDSPQTQYPSSSIDKNNDNLNKSSERVDDVSQPYTNNSNEITDINHPMRQKESQLQTSDDHDNQVSNMDGEKTLNNNSTNINKETSHVRPSLTVDSNTWRRRQRENRELRDQIKLKDTELQNLAVRLKQQINRTKELEVTLVNTTKTCGQFEKIIEQELANRTKLEIENDKLIQSITRLKNQLTVSDKEKSSNNELIRVLNATLMERETEVSILKLKMTRMQTNSSANIQFNPPSSTSLARPDPCKAYTMAGRSNSEFTRNSLVRSTMMAESVSTRSSTSQLQQFTDKDAIVWAAVPEELTPSKRPLLLDRNLPQFYNQYKGIENNNPLTATNYSSTPILRDRRYRTLPKSMKNPLQHQQQNNQDSNIQSSEKVPVKQILSHCLVTNLDDSNTTSQSSGNRSLVELSSNQNGESKQTKSLVEVSGLPSMSSSTDQKLKVLQLESKSYRNQDESLYNAEVETIGNNQLQTQVQPDINDIKTKPPPNIVPSPSTPIKISAGLKKIISRFRRSDSTSVDSQSKSDLRVEDQITPVSSNFQRGATRSTLVGPPNRAGPHKSMNFCSDKPFAEWDTNMLADWLTMIGLSMYANQCKRWVKCGAHIMNATPTEVDKGLGITNHLHRKKLRLAISELNGDCDKITKAAAKLDYLWVARWLDDIGLPQYKEAFINARVDGRVLNYLTVEDLISLGVKSLLHHSSIRCGIKVLRSINFDLQLLKRRATSEEIEEMTQLRECMNEQSEQNTESLQKGICDKSDVTLWTCHRVMEWLRMIEFAEFAPNLRGSGVHGGLIIHEDGFNNDTISTLLSIPNSRTLLRRHLSTYFENLVGPGLTRRKKQHKELSSNQQLNPATEIKTPKKSPLWFGKLKSSKGQDNMDEYLCPMYPVEPQILKEICRKSDTSHRESSNLPRIPESINV